MNAVSMSATGKQGPSLGIARNNESSTVEPPDASRCSKAAALFSGVVLAAIQAFEKLPLLGMIHVFRFLFS